MLLNKFGHLESAVPIKEGVSFYEVGLQGGTIYWWVAEYGFVVAVGEEQSLIPSIKESY